MRVAGKASISWSKYPHETSWKKCKLTVVLLIFGKYPSMRVKRRTCSHPPRCECTDLVGILHGASPLQQLVRHAPNEEVGVEVEAVGAGGALSLDVRLVVHAQHGVTPVPRHHQLVPAARLHAHLTDQRACAGACVEPAERERENTITPAQAMSAYNEYIQSVHEYIQ